MACWYYAMALVAILVNSSSLGLFLLSLDAASLVFGLEAWELSSVVSGQEPELAEVEHGGYQKDLCVLSEYFA